LTASPLKPLFISSCPNQHTIQQNFGISNFGISNFQFYQTTVNGPATINANKFIWLISNLGYTEPLTPVPEVLYNKVLL